jgi:6-phosphogluconolactonase (cycloisomerase 2 family)
MTLAYVGSRTTRERNARGEGISVFRVDADTGSLHLLHVVGGLKNPSYLALNRRADRLYAVHGDSEEASAFEVLADGNLALLGTVPCGGRNPVHLALDPTERHLVVSNHLSSNLAVLPVAASGELSGPTQIVSLPGSPGPHRVEQPFAKPHFNPFDPAGRHVVVPDKGVNRVFVFRFDDGALSPAPTPWVDSRETAGPRHLAFHPSAPYAYVINELDSTVTAYHYAADTGKLEAFQVLSALPDSWTRDSRASGIAIDAAGRTLYASNRAHDSIAVFRVDPATGRLTFVDATPSGGRTPRFFALAPGGRHMFVLNEDTDRIVTFAVDGRSGQLADTGRSVACGSPVCMVFADRD